LEEDGVVIGSIGAVVKAGSSDMELVRMYVEASQRGLGKYLVVCLDARKRDDAAKETHSKCVFFD